jgi:hypothetical protein
MWCSVFDNDYPIFVCDNQNVLDWLNNQNLKCLSLEDCKKSIPPAIISICSSQEHFDFLPKLAKLSKVLILPQIAFDSSPDASIYSIALLLESDFAEAERLRMHWKKTIQTCEYLHFAGEKTELFCYLQKEIDFCAVTDSKLEIGLSRSVAEYFEDSLENHGTRNDSCFIIEGDIAAEGMLMAKNPSINFNVDPTDVHKKFFEKKKNISSDFVLKVRDNKLIKCTFDGLDVLHEIQILVGDKHNLSITELGIGVNTKISNQINYNINSQVNEGVEGIHIGLGDGKTGYHLDFLVPGIKCL